MPKHFEERISAYSSIQLFNLVADIEKYPEFLPWCSAAKILSKDNNLLIAKLLIGYKGISESYTSKVILTPPRNVDEIGAIEVEMTEGPFSHLKNNWQFVPETHHHRNCNIKFSIDFAFKSKFLENIIGSFFEKAFLKMVSAFEERAYYLYK
jgi:coenzyme Q-binding protein COQ10